MTYDELKAHVLRHTDREDLTDTDINTFLAQAVSEINADVRCKEMVVRATTDVSTQFTNLPADCIEVINVQNNDWYGQPLRSISLHAADQVKADYQNSTSRPLYYSIVRESIEMIPAPDTTYSIGIVYFQKVTAPSDTVQSTAMLTNYPQLFILGVLKYAYDFLKEQGEYADKEAKFEREKERVIRAYNSSVHGAGATRARARKYG